MTAAAPPSRALGLDFGTTNTVLAWAHSHAAADPVVFRFPVLVGRAFVEHFRADRIESGDEFVSIANGLATIGTREDVESWIVTS